MIAHARILRHEAHTMDSDRSRNGRNGPAVVVAGMTCSLCTKPALYRAADKAFCKDHRAQAVKAATKLGSLKTGKGATC